MKKLQIFFIAILVLITLLTSVGQSYAFNSTSDSSAVLIAEAYQVTFDNRSSVLKSYLEQFNSPLAPYADSFIANADKYNLDWRLVASIAGLESSYGKQIPYNSYNGWGWGIYGDNVLRFNSWPEAIETISKGLREGYLRDNPDSNPYMIGPIYAASPTWAVRVDFIMAQMEAYKLKNAKSSLTLTI